MKRNKNIVDVRIFNDIYYNLYKLQLLIVLLIFIRLKKYVQCKHVIKIYNLTQCLSSLRGRIGKLKIMS